jgi:hypothetical protein
MSRRGGAGCQSLRLSVRFRNKVEGMLDHSSPTGPAVILIALRPLRFLKPLLACKPFPTGGHLTRPRRNGTYRRAAMKTNILKLLVVSLALILLGTGAAFAGGDKNHSTYSYRGTYHGGGDYHRPPYRPPHPGYWRSRPHYYRAPTRYYNYQNYYNRGCGRYYGGSYFSGAFSEPGFGFAFGTRGSW